MEIRSLIPVAMDLMDPTIMVAMTGDEFFFFTTFSWTISCPSSFNTTPFGGMEAIIATQPEFVDDHPERDGILITPRSILRMRVEEGGTTMGRFKIGVQKPISFFFL